MIEAMAAGGRRTRAQPRKLALNSSPLATVAGGRALGQIPPTKARQLRCKRHSPTHTAGGAVGRVDGTRQDGFPVIAQSARGSSADRSPRSEWLEIQL